MGPEGLTQPRGNVAGLYVVHVNCNLQLQSERDDFEL